MTSRRERSRSVHGTRERIAWRAAVVLAGSLVFAFGGGAPFQAALAQGETAPDAVEPDEHEAALEALETEEDAEELPGMGEDDDEAAPPPLAPALQERGPCTSADVAALEATLPRAIQALLAFDFDTYLRLLVHLSSVLTPQCQLALAAAAPPPGGSPSGPMCFGGTCCDGTGCY